MLLSSPQNPLIAIVGPTGTGKSQLAVSLAERCNGEIINGDALQIYEGIPIATNKLPQAARKAIPHHLLGCVGLQEQPWTVRQFKERATKVIQDIRARGRLPILVGGTHYYIQSLLCKNAVVEDSASSDSINEKDQGHVWPILSASAEEMLEMLRKLDPVMATQWHPNDQRKIRRSLEICLTTGKKASDVYAQQRLKQPMSDLYDTKQFPYMKSVQPLIYDTLILWTHAAPEVLDVRLERRVEDMISQGLLDEVKSMYDFMQYRIQKGGPPDLSRGIWVAIGFKEFLPYIRGGSHLPGLMQDGVDLTKVATRQYAKKQSRWIRLRLQRAISEAQSQHQLFLLDATDLSRWPKIEDEAASIASKFLAGHALPEPRSLSHTASALLNAPGQRKYFARFCETCDKTMMTEQQWFDHLKSKKHRIAVRPKIDWQKLYPKRICD
ncbi:hypothetical protein MMC21_004720 [Puttea exsequens]|nr:hypothetical protein [Puttea exsequens]